MSRISRDPIDLTIDELLAAREQLTDEEAETFDHLVESADNKGEFYRPGADERFRRKQVLEKAFPNRTVAPVDIRCWAVLNDVEKYQEDSGIQ